MVRIQNACIVDDDDIFRFILEKHIQTQNLADKILKFENGEEAIQYIEQFSDVSEALPDVIFLDINMPVMNGWQFMNRIKNVLNNMTKTPTIYMVSSSVDSRDIEKSKQYHEIKKYISKPIDKAEVMSLISGLSAS